MTAKKYVVKFAFVIFFLIAGLGGFFTWQSPDDAPSNQSRIFLSNFRTFTVEVILAPDVSKETLSGHLPSELNDLALQKLNSKVREILPERIDSSLFGRPYSFQTNPLNVAIVFYFTRSDVDEKKIILSEIDIKRSLVFTLMKSKDAQDIKRYKNLNRKNADALVSKYRSIEFKIKNSRILSNWSDVSQAIEESAKAIVGQMEPNLTQATQIEDNLKAIRF